MEHKVIKEVSKVWVTGQNQSATLVIPKKIALEYGLEKPSHVVIEARPEGILIRKLEI